MDRLLKVRRDLKKKKPEFLREEYWKKKSLGRKWRVPQGKDSKLKKQYKARGSLPSPGWRSPKLVRGLNRQGFREVRVFNVLDLNKVDPKKDVAVLGSTVGRKKRMDIIKKAEEKNIKVSNFSV